MSSMRPCFKDCLSHELSAPAVNTQYYLSIYLSCARVFCVTAVWWGTPVQREKAETQKFEKSVRARSAHRKRENAKIRKVERPKKVRKNTKSRKFENPNTPGAYVWCQKPHLKECHLRFFVHAMAAMAQGAKAGASSQGNHVKLKINSGENRQEIMLNFAKSQAKTAGKPC